MVKEIKKILVTDGNSRAALAITRSLGSKGYKIIIGEKAVPSLASSSKYTYKAVLYPDPITEYEDFCSKIKEIVDTYSIDLVVPVTDICVFPISNMVKEGVLSCKTPLAHDESMRLAANKSELTKVAEKLGMFVPLSMIIKSKDEISEEIPDIPFPIVIKPSRSRVMIDGKWEFTSVRYATSYKELIDILNNTKNEIYPIILQERVKGAGVGAFYCYDNGECVAKFAHRRIREKPPSGGVSVLRESVEIDPTIDKHSQLLLKHLNWHGVAMVEYKYDEIKKIPYFMEVNGRFWGSLQLAIDAGVDFPYLLVNVIQQSAQHSINEYEVGVRTRWLWGDIDLLLMLLFKSKSKLNLPDDYGPKWKVIAKILNPFGKNMNYEVFKLRDINPWLYETRLWLKNLLK